MLEKAWRRESSLKQERIWLLLRRITKKLVLTLARLKTMKEERNTKITHHHQNNEEVGLDSGEAEDDEGGEEY